MSLKTKTAAVTASAVLLLPGAIALAGPAVANSAPPPAAVSTANKTMYTIKTVNVRSGPSSEYGIIKTLPPRTKVVVVATKSGWSKDSQANVNWSKLATGGWVRSDFLSSKKPTAPLNNTGDGYVGDGLSRVYLLKDANVRSGPTSDAKILRTLPKGTELRIVSRKLGWSNEQKADVWWEEISTGGWVRTDFTQIFPDNKKLGQTGDPNCFFGGEKVKIIDVAEVKLNGKPIGSIPPGGTGTVSEEHGSLHCDEIWIDYVGGSGKRISGLVDPLNLSGV